MSKRWLSVAETLEQYPLGRSRLYEMIRSGEIASLTLGRKRVIDATSIEALLTRHAVAQGAVAAPEALLAAIDEDGRVDVGRIPPGTTLADLEAAKRIVAERKAAVA